MISSSLFNENIYTASTTGIASLAFELVHVRRMNEFLCSYSESPNISTAETYLYVQEKENALGSTFFTFLTSWLDPAHFQKK
jgi:hypothetical protein